MNPISIILLIAILIGIPAAFGSRFKNIKPIEKEDENEKKKKKL